MQIVKTGKILHAVIIVLAFLFTGTHILLNNKKIQQDAALHVVGIAESVLGTEVKAGRVQFVYPFGISIDNLTVYDLNGDTLAHIGSITGRIEPTQLLRHKINITSLRIQSPDIRLSVDSLGGRPNYAFLTDLFKSDNESKMAFRANSVLIRNGALSYDLKYVPATDSIFNASHIAVKSLNANVSLKSISSDSVSVVIRKFAFAEQSGFRLVRTKGAVRIGKNYSDLSGLSFSLPGSDVKIERLVSTAGLDTIPGPIPGTSVRINASVTGSDLKAFVPQTAHMTAPISLTLLARADNRLIDISKINVSTPEKELELAAQGMILLDDNMKLSGVRSTKIEGSFNDSLPKWLSSQLSGFGLTIPEECNSLGSGTLNATIESSSGKLESDISFICDAGTAKCTVSGVDGKYNAILSGYDVPLYLFTGNRDLGNCSLYAEMNLDKEPDGYYGSLNGNIGSIVYKRYRYRNIAFKGSFTPDNYLADIKFADRNGSLTVDAFLGTAPYQYLSMNINADNLNLHAYHLASRDSLTLTASATANIAGKDITDIDNIIGRITVDSLYYSDTQNKWSMNNLTANMGILNGVYRMTSVYSDFMNISMIGEYRFSTLGRSVSKACSDVLPTVGKLVTSKTGRYINSKPNFFVIEGRIDNTDFMQPIFNIPVSLDNPADIHLTFNDISNYYSGTVNVPGIRIADEHVSDASVSFNLADGSGSTEVSGKYGNKKIGLTSLSASLTAFSDMIQGTYSWNNLDGDLSGTVNSLTQFNGYDRRRGMNTTSTISPTTVIVNGVPWDIAETEISTRTHKVYISGLNLSNNRQFLQADGVISPDSSDVLKVSMYRIDLDNTLSMFNANKAQIMGIASGDVSIAGVTGNMAIDGSIDVIGFEFMDSYQGNLHADCRWNRKSQRVEVKAEADDIGLAHTLIEGYYAPGSKYIDMNLGAQNTDLHFLNRWTSVVFKELGGKATGNLRIYGSLPKLDMEGEAILENGYFQQTAINTTFLVKHDTLWFEPGKMLFKDVEFYDEYGHDGIMTCILTHDHFADWKVDMSADVANMLVYNQLESDKSNFHAKVYAEGSMTLSFTPQDGLAVYVDARTAPGTRLGFQPSSGSVADYNFITFVDRNEVNINEEIISSIIPQQQKKNGKQTRFILDFDIECSEDALIDMSISSLTGYFRGNGRVSFKFTPQDGPILNGIYNLSYGQCSFSLEDVIRKNFTLADGSYVRFNGAPMDTEINLITYHTVNSASIYDLDPSASATNKVRVRCLLGVSGKVTEPQLSFDIDMPSGTPEEKAILASATTTEEQRNNQFLYLLAIGRFYSYNVAAVNDGQTPTAMESVVNNTVNGQINNILSQVLDNEKVSISSNVTASSFLTNDETNLSNKELEGILEAHLLNNRLLVNGNFGYRENTINNTSNFIGDFEVKYLLLPRQGISIKGYNKSNDKYFSKTTLTTQGVGLVFEKDF